MPSSSSLSQQQHSYYRSSIFWLFLPPALGGFLFGYDIGGTSYAILQLASIDNLVVSGTLSLQDAPLKTGWFVSAPSAGALLGTAILVYMDQSWKTTSNYNSSKPTLTWWSRFVSKWTLSPIGRKTELLYAGVLYALGGCLQYAASLVWVVDPLKFSVVILGRWIYGMGIGFAMHGGPTYLAETTPPSVRGMVVGAKEIAIVLGILCGYLVGDKYCTNNNNNDNNNNDNNDNNGWAKVYGLTVLGAISMVAFSKTIPESARYLVCGNHHHVVRQSLISSSSSSSSQQQHNGEEPPGNETIEAKAKQQILSEVLESLRFVWHPKRALEEHSKLMEIYNKHHLQQHYNHHNQNHNNNNSSDSESSLSQQQQPLSNSLSSILSDPSVRPALKAGLGLVILQQITGQPSVLSYATPVLASVPGLGASASVLLAVFKVLATSLSVILVERNGRKTLLQVGCSLMLIALMVLAVAFSSESDDNNENDEESSLDAKSLFALLGMFAYIAGYQIGFGPITWLMISEVFPQNVRGTTVALAVQANFALNALVQLLVPILQTSLGMAWTFFIFGCLTAYSLWFVQHSVPETKGLTLEEIEEKLVSMVATNDDVRAVTNQGGGMFEDAESEFETTARRRRTSHSDNEAAAATVNDDDERIRLLP